MNHSFFSKSVKALFVAVVGSLCANTTFAKSSSPESTDVRWIVKGVDAKKQETHYWCWAAVTQAILSTQVAKSEVPQQCEIVSKMLNKNCCELNQNGDPSLDCARGFQVQPVLNAYGVSNFTRPGYRGTWKDPDYTAFDEVVAHIKSDRVVAIVISYPSVAAPLSSHVILAYAAYTKLDGRTFVVAWDPLYNTHRTFARKDVQGNLAWFDVIFIR